MPCCATCRQTMHWRLKTFLGDELLASVTMFGNLESWQAKSWATLELTRSEMWNLPSQPCPGEGFSLLELLVDGKSHEYQIPARLENSTNNCREWFSTLRVAQVSTGLKESVWYYSMIAWNNDRNEMRGMEGSPRIEYSTHWLKGTIIVQNLHIESMIDGSEADQQ